MISKSLESQKIGFIIEKFFIISGLVILIATFLVGLYFNKYDQQENQKNNLKRVHEILSHLIVPSLIISDLSEVRNLLYKSSGDDETFLVIDRDGTIIMDDYNKNQFFKFALDYKLIHDCQGRVIQYRYFNGKKYLINCSILKNNDALSGESNIGVLLSFTHYSWVSFSPIIVYFVGILICLFLFLIILFRRLLYRKLLQPLILLKDKILTISNNTSAVNHVSNIDNLPKELVEIKIIFEKLLLNLQEEYDRSAQAQKMKALIELAACVAHDIRSPLTALEVIIKDIKNIPEEQRIVIRNAANRISDIANNLLTQYKKRDLSGLDNNIENRNPELIADLLLSLVSEKRAKHRNDTIKFFLNLEEKAYGKFSLVSSSAFNRVISNLLDNAIEASAAKIDIDLSEVDTSLLIQIKDNGCGISPEAIFRIRNGESVTSKENGNGLGLLYVVKTIETEWKGSIYINSSHIPGTSINFLLPLASPPKWFLTSLSVEKNQSIVVLDDDESIHHVWKKRFEELDINLKFFHYYNPQELLNDYLFRKFSADIFLIDFEFIGCEINGLDIINQLNIASKAYLVTSRYEDLTIRNIFVNKDIKIIPKTFAAHIPIDVTLCLSNKADLIFIDDDTTITDAWALHGFLKKKAVSTYNSINGFKSDIDKYDLNTPVYIDSNLNDFQKGQDFAKELYANGYKNIYLTTGYPASMFEYMPWIRAIVGKEPPF